MIWLLLWVLFAQTSDFIVEAEVSDLTPYVGEQIVYTFRIYAYVEQDITLDDQLPDFEGFWVSNILQNDQGLRIVDGVQYNVVEVLVEIAPQNPGVLMISPATLNIPETPFRGALTLQTEPIEVNVQQLPENAPEGFNGAVGQFSMLTEIDQSRVMVGEPLRLIADFQGVGNFEQLLAPRMNVFSGDWQIFSSPANPTTYGTNAISGLRLGQRQFEWLLIPQTSGSQQIPPLVFSYFDPQLEEYRTIESPAYSIEVFPGETSGSIPAVNNQQPELGIKPAPARLRTGSTGLFAGFWLLWFLFPVVAAFSGGWIIYRRVQAERRRLDRRKTALRRAHQRLKEADTGNRIARIVYAYVADQRNIPNRDVTHNNWLNLLPEGYDADKLADCVAEAAGYQFSPTADKPDIEPLTKRTARLLSELDKAWSDD